MVNARPGGKHRPLLHIERIAAECGEQLGHGHLHEDAPVVHDDAVVDEFLHVLDDMRGEENGFLLALGVFAQVFHEQTPVAGVEPHRKVVEYEQLGILRQDEPERHLGTLAAGHARNTLPRRHAELLHQAVVGVAVPARIELRIETFDLLDGHEGVLHMPFDEQGDARPRPGRHYIDAQDIVENVKRVQEPYKKANRKFHPDNTVIKINDNVTIGDGSLHIMAGPCSVESEEQIVQIAKDVKASGATLLRGGAFKPRTSPYAFQGLKAEGLDLLKTARRETGLPIVTEIMRASHIDMFENVDIIQVGARNMQNFELLKELGKIDKPILLKRGLSATIEEWLMSAEYIMAGGNDKVMLCERGIRTYETFTRNTLDISAIPIIKKLSHLPVIVDPSHASGKSWLVEPLAMAAVAAGADGLIIEVHNDPPHALSDGAQSLTPKQFDGVAKKVFGLKKAVDKLN